MESTERVFKCTECCRVARFVDTDTQFFNFAELESHLLDVHLNSTPFNCPWCPGMVGTSASEILDHIESTINHPFSDCHVAIGGEVAVARFFNPLRPPHLRFHYNYSAKVERSLENALLRSVFFSSSVYTLAPWMPRESVTSRPEGLSVRKQPNLKTGVVWLNGAGLPARGGTRSLGQRTDASGVGGRPGKPAPVKQSGSLASFGLGGEIELPPVSNRSALFNSSAKQRVVGKSKRLRPVFTLPDHSGLIRGEASKIDDRHHYQDGWPQARSSQNSWTLQQSGFVRDSPPAPDMPPEPAHTMSSRMLPENNDSSSPASATSSSSLPDPSDFDRAFDQALRPVSPYAIDPVATERASLQPPPAKKQEFHAERRLRAHYRWAREKQRWLREQQRIALKARQASANSAATAPWKRDARGRCILPAPSAARQDGAGDQKKSNGLVAASELARGTGAGERQNSRAAPSEGVVASRLSNGAGTGVGLGQTPAAVSGAKTTAASAETGAQVLEPPPTESVGGASGKTVQTEVYADLPALRPLVNRLLVCKLCDELLSSSHADAHICHVHLKRLPFICVICRTSFMELSKAAEHITRLHQTVIYKPGQTLLLDDSAIIEKLLAANRETCFPELKR